MAKDRKAYQVLRSDQVEENVSNSFMIVQKEVSLADIGIVLEVLFSLVVSLHNQLQDFTSEVLVLNESQSSLGEIAK